jgi:hypothetical protein
MSELRNVTVVKEANVFFDGKVVSRTVLFGDGSKKTLGLMQPGVYGFSTPLSVFPTAGSCLTWPTELLRLRNPV